MIRVCWQSGIAEDNLRGVTGEQCVRLCCSRCDAVLSPVHGNKSKVNVCDNIMPSFTLTMPSKSMLVAMQRAPEERIREDDSKSKLLSISMTAGLTNAGTHMHMPVGMQRTPLERVREHHSTHALEEAAVVEPGPVAL